MNPLAPLLRVLRCSVLCPDPAIDVEAMTVDAEGKPSPLLHRYVRERDEELLRLVEGVEPDWIVVDTIDALPSLAQRRVKAFRAAVHAVQGKEPMQVTSPGTKGPYEGKGADYGVTLAPEEWVQAFADRFGTDAVQEMGEVALSLSRLPRGAKGPFALWGGTALSS